MTFTVHERNGAGAMLIALLVTTLIETAAVHLLVTQWSATAAWCLTALSAYGAIWLLGVYRSLHCRPIVLDEHALVVRVGMLWSVTVPLGEIASVEPAAVPYPPRRAAGYLRAVMLGEPRFLIKLRRALVAEGVYGMRKEVRVIGVAVDEPAAFREALRARLAARRG